MNITYPHLGYLSLVLPQLFDGLGVTPLPPPPISPATIALGSRYAPEGACLPYKIMLGNFWQALDRGADAVVSINGAGKCRMGFYHLLHQLALAERLPAERFYTINLSGHILGEIRRFLQQVAMHKSTWRILGNIRRTLATLQALDALHRAKCYYAPRAASPDTVIGLFHSSVREIVTADGLGHLRRLQDTTVSCFRDLAEPTLPAPVKIALLGEFYVLLEPYSNHDLEDRLARLGVEVHKTVYAGDWAAKNMVLAALGLYREEKHLLRQARPYLHHHIGGEGLKTVGTAHLGAASGMDGLIHLAPFGCMPEVVARYALSRLTAEHRLPVLTVSLDEHASDTGLQTRLEAFVDCLRRRRR